MLRRKLTSQSGASITYALLLFLVCAVVSSVVLAAATAASGRISNSVESDQRYYSVTSAAKLLKELFDGKKVEIVEKKQVSLDENGNPEDEETNVSGYPTIAEIPDDGSPYTATPYTDEMSLNLLTEASVYYTGINEGAAPPDDGRTITLDVGNITSLKVTINEIIDPNSGRITLTLYNSEGNPYYMNMVFDPAASVKEESRTSGTRDNRIRTDTKTSTLTWQLTSIG